jgi:pyruvate formate lyase activating enzyme
MPEKNAYIANIQRMSMDDGPGIRTTVFLKGCSLKCVWCHNPETISSKPHILWHDEKCIGCGLCIDTCPESSVFKNDAGKIQINASCKQCLSCVDICPGAALEMIGHYESIDNLYKTLIKDISYYQTSGGGVTVSGGEPCLQTEAVTHLFSKLKQNSIHTALDTCGYCDSQSLESLLPQTDLVLFDIKEIDPNRHVEYTGHSNERIINNLEKICQIITDLKLPTRLWIRTPIIPDTTDTYENIMGIGNLVSDLPKGILQRWELCAFNPLCEIKYERLYRVWPFQNHSWFTQQQMIQFEKIARQACDTPDKVFWSGYVT